MKTHHILLILAIIGALVLVSCVSPTQPRFPDEPDPEEPPPDDDGPSTSFLEVPGSAPIPVYFA